MADGEGGACHGPFDAEGAAGSSDERRLARAELSGDRHDVSGPKLGSELGRDALSLFR
jgi:hypothetical protein